MARIKYIVTTSVVRVEDSEVESYGIACLGESAKKQCIDDISTDKEIIEDAVIRFNKYKLSPHHFAEAVEDVLTDTSIID